VEDTLADIQFKHIVPATPEALQRGAWLLLLKPQRVPRHLVLLADGRWYSLTIDGVELALPAVEHAQTLYNKGRKMRALELKLQGLNPVPDFEPYQQLGSGQTCLAPIHNSIQRHVGRAFAAQSVHHLIEYLRAQQLLGATLSLNMGQESSFTFKHYTHEDILVSIHRLRQSNMLLNSG